MVERIARSPVTEGEPYAAAIPVVTMAEQAARDGGNCLLQRVIGLDLRGPGPCCVIGHGRHHPEKDDDRNRPA